MYSVRARDNISEMEDKYVYIESLSIDIIRLKL